MPPSRSLALFSPWCTKNSPNASSDVLWAFLYQSPPLFILRHRSQDQIYPSTGEGFEIKTFTVEKGLGANCFGAWEQSESVRRSAHNKPVVNLAVKICLKKTANCCMKCIIFFFIDIIHNVPLGQCCRSAILDLHYIVIQVLYMCKPLITESKFVFCKKHCRNNSKPSVSLLKLINCDMLQKSCTICFNFLGEHNIRRISSHVCLCRVFNCQRFLSITGRCLYEMCLFNLL